MTADPFAGRPRSGPPKEWSIAIYGGPSLEELQPLAAPALTAALVDDVVASFVADPFLFDGHLFFEIKNIAAKKGEIAVADFASLRYLGVVLAEPFHLSYPHVFRAGEEIFMTPESIEAGAVRLYRAVDFPRRWELDRTIVDGVYADPTPFRHDGRWWLLACPRPMRHDALSLFWADDVRGPWREHPRSPIVTSDRRRARPAGRVQTIDGQLVRFAQDCDPAYGSGVRAFAITTLTTTEYAERELAPAPLLYASGRGWNRDGMHHIDLQPLAGGWLACVDGYTLIPESAPSVEVIDVDSIAEEWEAMLEVTTAHRVFSSPQWFRAASRGLTPHVLVARRHDRITAILPLVKQPDGLLTFASAMSDVNDAIAFDAETVRHLLRAAGGPFDLRCLRDDGVLFEALRGMPEAHIERDIDCFVADVDASYFATRTRNFRRSLTRCERRARAAGLEVVELPEWDAELFLALNRARFGDKSRFANEAAAAFVRLVAPASSPAVGAASPPPTPAAGRGRYGRRDAGATLFRPFAIRRGDDILALDLVVDSGTSLGVWNGGFLPEVEDFSPGRLLFAAEIRAAIAAGYARFELLRGTHPYKASWATHTETLYRASHI